MTSNIEGLVLIAVGIAVGITIAAMTLYISTKWAHRKVTRYTDTPAKKE